MADTKISDLAALLNSAIASGDLIPVVDVSAGDNKKLTFLELDKRYAAESSGTSILNSGLAAGDVIRVDDLDGGDTKELAVSELDLRYAEESSGTAILNSGLAGGDIIRVDDADGGDVKDLTITELDKRYPASGTLLADDGTAGAPGVAFTDDTDNGMYRSTTDTIELAAGGYSGIQVKKSTGNYANLGIGGSASVSDSYPILVERSVGSLHMQVSNPIATASSFAKLIMKASAGAVSTGEFAVYNKDYTFVDAYDRGRMVLRISGTTKTDSGISLVADDTGNTIRMYTGGVTSASRVFEAFTGYVQINGGVMKGLRAISSTDTAADSDYTLICDATGGAISVNLPAASTNTDRIYVIKKIDATANVTIDPNASELIDGASTLVLSTQYDTRTIQCDGTAWHVIGN